MASGDVYELIDRQLFAGQEVLNVYFFKTQPLGGAATAQDLIDSYIGQLLPDIVAMQVNDCLHVEISARNLFNDADRAVNAISTAGANSGEYGATFNAIGYSLVQDNGSIKNGSKRVAGIPEGASVDGVIDGGTYIALLNTLAAAFTGTLDWGIIATWLPVIVKRIAEGAGVYRLPANSGEAVTGAITDAQFNPLVTSQTSRKIGVGV